MSLSIEPQADARFVRLAGELAGEDSKALSDAVNELLDGGASRIVLDMSGVAYVNSGGLGALVQITAKVNARQGRLLLAGPSPFVQGVLESTRLDRFFDIYPSVDEARKQIAG
ncbi:MAG: STAS domain-containing protein [Phycisphaerae bacterium]